MQNFKSISLVLFITLCVYALPLEINAKRSMELPEIKKSDVDLKIDEFIDSVVGEEFRRASIFDIYPLVKDKEKARYNDYARNFLKEFSRGLLLKVYKVNYDKDFLMDYAVVVHNIQEIKNYLLIANKDRILYLEEFQGDYLELIDGGGFPTVVVTEDSKSKIGSPALKIVSISKKGKALYFDSESKQWKEVNLAF